MSIGPLGQFIELAKYWLGAPMMILGLFFISVGGRYPTTSFFLFSTLTVGSMLLFGIFVFALPSDYMPMWTVYLFAPICYAMGAGLGYGAAKWPKIGIAVIAFAIGALFGSLVYNSVSPAQKMAATSFLVDWAILFSSGVIVALICIFLFDYAVILGSGIVGAYLFLRVSKLKS